MNENFNGQILLPDENKVKNAIVFLHGYGANSEDLINIGAYSKGSNPNIDLSIEFMPLINQLLRQEIEEQTSLEETLEVIAAIFEKINTTN